MAYIGAVPIPQSNEVRQEFLIDTASQSTFFTRTNYAPQFVEVYKNGLRLQTADFTATNGYTVTLATPAVLNDVVAIEYRTNLQFNTNNQLQLNPGGSTVINSQGFDVLYEDTGGAVEMKLDLQNFTPTSTPASPAAGDVYFDSSTNKLRCFDGTIWNDLF